MSRTVRYLQVLALCTGCVLAQGSGAGESRPHPIDTFVADRLAPTGRAAAPRADRATLLRRASLALTGLPPDLTERERYLTDRVPGAFERAVDRLLASPRYGEHQAVGWMDLARYADTNGYEKDRPRDAWPWRDWVIRAFNDDLPFDAFTVRQLAGDLLPNATPEDRIATGFLRNSMLNDEGGVDPEEFRIVAVKDRVDTTARTWLALTLDCAQCHDHPNDPVTLREYYRFAAFFDSTADDGVSLAPTLPWPRPDRAQLLAGLESEEAPLRARFRRKDEDLRTAFRRWCEAQRAEMRQRSAHPVEAAPWMQLGPLVTGNVATAHGRRFGPERGVRLDRSVSGMRWKEVGSESPDPVLPLEGRGAATYFFRTLQVGAARDVEFELSPAAEGATAPEFRIWINGQESEAPESSGGWPEPRRLRLRNGRNELLLKLSYDLPTPVVARLLDGPWPPRIRELLSAEQPWEGPAGQTLDTWWRNHDDRFANLRKALQEISERRARVGMAQALVLQELEEPRETHVLERGDWNRPGARVLPGTPSLLPPFPEGLPPNRLGLARWLVGPAADRTARVFVNRIWASHFGRGLVDTLDDFGTAGSPATHPELLDFLAQWFQEHGWSVKALHRFVVTSKTWQQRSDLPEGDDSDPDNLLLGRGPRFRLGYEAIRDLGLTAAGLLHHQVGGPSVMPIQPPGIWEQSYTVHDLKDRWVADAAPQRYRRGLYVYLRRTAPYPSYALFDGPRRDVCSASRSRTITPLQNLVVWNDRAFLEAAAGLGARMHAEADQPERAATLGFRLCTTRNPTRTEIDRLLALVTEAQDAFQRADDRGRAFLEAVGVDPLAGEAPNTGLSDDDTAERAAWIVAGQTLLSLHETLTQH